MACHFLGQCPTVFSSVCWEKTWPPWGFGSEFTAELLILLQVHFCPCLRVLLIANMIEFAQYLLAQYTASAPDTQSQPGRQRRDVASQGRHPHHQNYAPRAQPQKRRRQAGRQCTTLKYTAAKLSGTYSLSANRRVSRATVADCLV